MGEYLYQIMFIGGKAIAFQADEVNEYGNDLEFTVDGAIVAQFNKNNIAGYLVAGVNSGKDER